MKTVQRISTGIFYLILLPGVMALCGWQSWAWWSWVNSPPQSISSTVPATDEAIQVQIPPGTGIDQIGQDLAAAGVIRSQTAWRLWALWLRVSDRSGGFKAGTYKLNPTQPLSQVAEQVWRGQVMQLSFTVPEGWSLQQMATYFESLGYFKAQDFLTAASQIPKDRYPWLPADLPFLEGFLYPDTYQLPSDRVTPQQIITLMLDRFEQVALPLYQQSANRTQLNLMQWVTLASIVEKEAVIAAERPRIAGVFTARLRRGIKLETDPTVEYGLGIRQTADQPLTYAQVRTPSPYNTYLNPGLPPTPIASPGLASLKAALDPENTDYLFFVAKYDGTHVFSKTPEAHEAAKNAIRKQREASQ